MASRSVGSHPARSRQAPGGRGGWTGAGSRHRIPAPLATPHGASRPSSRPTREQTPTPYKGKYAPPAGVGTLARGTSAARNIVGRPDRDGTESAPRRGSYGPSAAWDLLRGSTLESFHSAPGCPIRTKRVPLESPCRGLSGHVRNVWLQRSEGRAKRTFPGSGGVFEPGNTASGVVFSGCGRHILMKRVPLESPCRGPSQRVRNVWLQRSEVRRKLTFPGSGGVFEPGNLTLGGNFSSCGGQILMKRAPIESPGCQLSENVRNVWLQHSEVRQKLTFLGWGRRKTVGLRFPSFRHQTSIFGVWHTASLALHSQTSPKLCATRLNSAGEANSARRKLAQGLVNQISCWTLLPSRRPGVVPPPEHRPSTPRNLLCRERF